MGTERRKRSVGRVGRGYGSGSERGVAGERSAEGDSGHTEAAQRRASGGRTGSEAPSARCGDQGGGARAERSAAAACCSMSSCFSCSSSCSDNTARARAGPSAAPAPARRARRARRAAPVSRPAAVRPPRLPVVNAAPVRQKHIQSSPVRPRRRWRCWRRAGCAAAVSGMHGGGRRTAAAPYGQPARGRCAAAGAGAAGTAICMLGCKRCRSAASRSERRQAAAKDRSQRRAVRGRGSTLGGREACSARNAPRAAAETPFTRRATLDAPAAGAPQRSFCAPSSHA
jgi:hypothetical protein